MWPRTVDWRDLRFGLEVEVIGAGNPAAVPLLPGWKMALDELQSPPLNWRDCDQVDEMLGRLRAHGFVANWSCGLHVHVGIEPWGQDFVLPMVGAALVSQEALRSMFRTASDRLIYCPPVVPEMRERYRQHPVRDSLVHAGRPQAHRCGVNAGAWFDNRTVEIRYANGSLYSNEVRRTIELCLRFVAAVGAGRPLPAEPGALAAELDVPPEGYPPPQPAPRWYRERVWLEEHLIPVLLPLLDLGSEIRHIRPVENGLVVITEPPEGPDVRYLARAVPGGWQLERWSGVGAV